MRFRAVHAVLLAVSFLLVSCSEMERDIQGYEYRLELAEDGTKAQLNGDGVFWKNGDKVGLFLGNGSSVSASVDASTSPKTIVFSTSQPLADGTQVRAYYPYVPGNTDVSATKISFASSQTGGADAAMPLAGVPFRIQGNGNKGVVHFVNLGSVLDFKVYAALHRETVRSVTLAVTGGTHPVSGEARLDLTGVVAGKDPSLVLDWGQGSPNSSVSLTQTQTVAVSKAAESEHLYMVVAPGTYSGNITVETDMATYTVPFENQTFTRNAIQRINVNLEGEYVVRVGPVFSLENDKMAAYLDDVYRSPYSPDDRTVSYMNAYYQGNTNKNNRLDWPKPVPVSWTNPSSGNGAKVVYVYNDAEMTDKELSVEVSSSTATSVDIYNLIPGRTYYYKVTIGDQPYTSGSFQTTGRRRMMKVGDSPYGRGYANNCRDFGGQPAMNGKTIKYGKMYRGSNMDLTTAVQKDFLLHYMGVVLDVDLRSYSTSDGAKGTGGGYLNDALNLGDNHLDQVYNSWGELTDSTSMHTTLTRIFGVVAQGQVPYIHCMVGADRTGYVCMLLEAILGVTQGWCDVDYELTSFSGAADDGTPRIRYSGENYYYFTYKDYWSTSVRGVDFINTFPGNTFQDRAIYYLTHNLGITEAQITAFQNNMLE